MRMNDVQKELAPNISCVMIFGYYKTGISQRWTSNALLNEAYFQIAGRKDATPTDKGSSHS